MSLKFDSSSFFESSGNSAAAFPEQIRDAIASHACSIWSQYPSYFTQGTNPVSSFARGYMNGVCTAEGQPVPPAPFPPYTGGQCDGTLYNVTYDVQITEANGNVSTQSSAFNAFGAITSVFATSPDPAFSNLATVRYISTNGGNEANEVVGTFGPGSNTLVLQNIQMTRVDGQPDNCGNPDAQYPPSPPPTQIDLSTTVNITNFDGSDNIINIEWNQASETYNFPFYFKVNGVNVTLDMSGITIFGDPSVTSDNYNPTSEPPGSDGGHDVENAPYTLPEKNEYPVLPDINVPKLITTILKTAVCDLGAISLVDNVVGLLPGQDILYQLILDTIKGVLEELCAEASDVGIPEIYPVLPGADRPVIMYYYKENNGGIKGRSTYVSTLPNPSSSAIAEIGNVNPAGRFLGKIVKSIKLLDGSRIVARGKSEGDALAQFQFLLSRVSAEFVPADVSGCTITTQNEKLQEVEVECSQIEYYPDGKSFGRNPSALRIITFE